MATKLVSGIDSWFCTLPLDNHEMAVSIKESLGETYHQVEIVNKDTCWIVRYRYKKGRK